MKRLLGTLAVLAAVAAAAAAAGAHAKPLDTMQAASLPAAEVEAGLPESHPAAIYAYAKRLFAEGRRDEAVTWFYVGQLRFRFHLAASPTLPRSGDPALMASLNASVGQVLNEWAGGSPQGWADSIDKALAWDAAHPNAVTSQQAHEKAWKDTRSGLAELRDSILANAQSIRAQRAQRGLENR
ncbi:MAG: hypothetical protein EOO33_14870 [Comamonadaceae bacterium]|nr:MAG: hypothetical protein EOO33_14870 [Comamonadaceae bacterium]